MSDNGIRLQEVLVVAGLTVERGNDGTVCIVMMMAVHV